MPVEETSDSGVNPEARLLSGETLGEGTYRPNLPENFRVELAQALNTIINVAEEQERLNAEQQEVLWRVRSMANEMLAVTGNSHMIRIGRSETSLHSSFMEFCQRALDHQDCGIKIMMMMAKRMDEMSTEMVKLQNQYHELVGKLQVRQSTSVATVPVIGMETLISPTTSNFPPSASEVNIKSTVELKRREASCKTDVGSIDRKHPQQDLELSSTHKRRTEQLHNFTFNKKPRVTLHQNISRQKRKSTIELKKGRACENQVDNFPFARRRTQPASETPTQNRRTRLFDDLRSYLNKKFHSRSTHPLVAFKRKRKSNAKRKEGKRCKREDSSARGWVRRTQSAPITITPQKLHQKPRNILPSSEKPNSSSKDTYQFSDNPTASYGKVPRISHNEVPGMNTNLEGASVQAETCPLPSLMPLKPVATSKMEDNLCILGNQTASTSTTKLKPDSGLNSCLPMNKKPIALTKGSFHASTKNEDTVIESNLRVYNRSYTHSASKERKIRQQYRRKEKLKQRRWSRHTLPRGSMGCFGAPTERFEDPSRSSSKFTYSPSIRNDGQKHTAKSNTMESKHHYKLRTRKTSNSNAEIKISSTAAAAEKFSSKKDKPCLVCNRPASSDDWHCKGCSDHAQKNKEAFCQKMSIDQCTHLGEHAEECGGCRLGKFLALSRYMNPKGLITPLMRLIPNEYYKKYKNGPC